MPIPFAALALFEGISAGISIFGSIKAGGAAKKAGELEAQAARENADRLDWNAKVADLQAEDAIQRGAEEESRYRAGVRQLIGSQRAGYAGSNIVVGFGSALDVQEDTAVQGELDALTIRTDAAREAWGFRIEAQDLRQQAGIARRTGQYRAEAGRQQATQQYIRAGSTLLGAGESFVRQRYGLR